MATRGGFIKRTETTEFANLRAPRASLPSCCARDDPFLIGVALTDGSRDVLLGSKRRHGRRFSERDAPHRPRRHGRQVHGTGRGRRSGGHMSVVEKARRRCSSPKTATASAPRSTNTACRAAAARASGHRNLTDLRPAHLPGSCWCMKEDILIITDDGTIKIPRLPVSSISVQGRNTQGVRLMRVRENSRVVCVARAEAEKKRRKKTARIPRRGRKANRRT